MYSNSLIVFMAIISVMKNILFYVANKSKDNLKHFTLFVVSHLVMKLVFDFMVYDESLEIAKDQLTKFLQHIQGLTYEQI